MFCSLMTHPESQDICAYILGKARPDIDKSITDIGRVLLKEKFLLPGETVANRLAHACVAFSSDHDHAFRLADYIEKGWFMFATPLLANGGTNRGLPISCFLNYVEDSREGLGNHYMENIFLSTNGGGIGSHWSDVRSVGSSTSGGSESTGIIPFIKVADSQVLAFKQGRTRQGAYATYLDVSHPEIEEYLTIRSADGGDQNRKSFHTHIGVCLSDAFMEAVSSNRTWSLVDPHTGETTKVIQARDLWSTIIKKRMSDRGEPYLFFSSSANDYSSYATQSDRTINGSNLCTEITLGTDSERTAVCCLSSVNVAKFDEWEKDELFIADLVEMLDNALHVFTHQAPLELDKAIRTAVEERSIGLGAMGLHDYCQSKGRVLNSCSHVFSHIKNMANEASTELGSSRGVPIEAEHLGRRNTHLLAIAPNATSSLMLGTSPGIEPFRSNLFTVVQGPVVSEFKNPHLDELVKLHTDGDKEWYDRVWYSIRSHNGSVQHIFWMSDEDKKVFRTFSEINQMEIVDAASLRQRHICQAQSLNLCFRSDADPKYVNRVHMRAWTGHEDGNPLKSLYYCRVDVDSKIESTSAQAVRDEDVLPDSGGNYDTAVVAEFDDMPAACPLNPTTDDECLACQG